MSWSDSTWEDIAGSPSTVPQDIFHGEDISVYDHQLSQERTFVNGHISAGEIQYTGSQKPYSPAVKDAGSTRDTALASDNKMAAWHLSESNGLQLPKDYSNTHVPLKMAMVNGTLKTHPATDVSVNGILKARPATDVLINKATSQASVPNSKSFEASGVSVRTDSKSRSKPRRRAMEDGRKLDTSSDAETKGGQVTESDAVPTVVQAASAVHTPANSQSHTGDQSLSSTIEIVKSKKLSSALDGSEQYSQVNPRKSRSSRTYTLHEYEKEKEHYSRYSIYQDGSDHQQEGAKVGEDEDTVNVVMCLVFCIMGVGVFIGLICVLIHLSKQKEQDQTQSPVNWENSYDTWLNSLYGQRVAEVIRTASQTDQDILHADGRAPTAPTDRLQLCDIHPPDLGNYCFVSYSGCP